MGVRLGFHYHIPAEIRAGGIWMPGYLGRFIDSLAVCCEQVVCFQHTPTQAQRAEMDYCITSTNVNLVDIGPRCAAWKRSLFTSRYVTPLNAWGGELDVLLSRGPSPLLPAFCRAALRNDISTALLLVGSYVDGVDDLPQPRWRKELIRLYGHINQYQQDYAARKSLTFVNSRKLYDQYHGRIPHLVETRTTTLSASDFFVREDTCLNQTTRLLYTGRFDRGKGLLEMFEVLSLLVERGHDVILDLVGWDDSRTGVVEEILALAEKFCVSDRAFNHGRKAVGPELFAYYRQADIYLIASKLSEGFPRTIWEAMAHSLPVLATNIGSIPQFIGDSAELIEPGSASAIADGVEKLLNDPARRRELIVHGLALARENTLERRGREMIDSIEQWLSGGL